MAASLAAAAFVLHWSLSKDNYFFADDWNWLYSAATHPVSAWFYIFPFQLYNDRPVGALFIKALFHIFGLNHVAFHGVYLALHLLNVALSFFIAKRLGRSDKAAFCSAILFGCWGSALHAPTWVAAVFDLLSCTLILLAVLAHLGARSPWLVACLFAVAIRTKEIAIVLPFVLAAHDIWLKEKFSRLAKAYGPMLLVFLAYSAAYLRISSHQVIPVSDPYHLSVSFAPFFSGIEFYLGALLYIDHPGNAVPIIFFLVLLGSVVLRWRAEVFGFCGFVLFLLPVLFLPHHRDYLYLYLPSVFFWIGLTGLVLRLFGAFFPKQADYVLIALALIGITWQYYMRYLPGPVRWSLNNFGAFRTDIEQLKRIQPVIAPKTTLFIYGLTEYMNPFNYGPCYSVRLVYGENQIDCVIEKSPEEIRTLFAAHAEPKLLFSYKDGRLTRESNAQ